MTMIARSYPDRTFMCDGQPVNEPKLVISVTGDTDIELFKQLMRRALNCWDGAPPQVKELGDIIEHGKLLQDYQSQAASSGHSK